MSIDTEELVDDDDDKESCIDFEFRTVATPCVAELPGGAPPEKVLNGGRIFPVDVAEDTNDGERSVAGREDDQKLTETKINASFLSNVIYGLNTLKNLIACQSERTRVSPDFNSVLPKKNSVESNSHYSSIPSHKTQESTQRSSFHKNLWTPICNWFGYKPKNSKKNKKKMKPRIVEINGRGPISEVLQAIAAGRLSTDRKSSVESSSRPSTTPPSPLNYMSPYHGISTEIEREKKSNAERESSIASLVSFCKHSCEKKEESKH